MYAQITVGPLARRYLLRFNGSMYEVVCMYICICMYTCMYVCLYGWVYGWIYDLCIPPHVRQNSVGIDPVLPKPLEGTRDRPK